MVIHVTRLLYIALFVANMANSLARADDFRQGQPVERAVRLSTDEAWEDGERRVYYLRPKGGGIRTGLLSVSCYKGKDDVYISFKYSRDKKYMYGSRTTNKTCQDFHEQFEKGTDWTQYLKFEDNTWTGELIFEETQLDREDRKWMSHVNEVFHKNLSSQNHTTRSLHHGVKTKEVYVVIPGIGIWNNYLSELSAKLFFQGSNVIFGSLPGHEEPNYQNKRSTPFIPELADPASWLQYAETLSRLARMYGEKVIIVGQSTGGNLAVRMAEQNLIDGMILLQPLIGTLTIHKYGAHVLDRIFNSKQKLAHGFSRMATYALELEKIPHKPISSNIKTRIYLADFDPVVYSPSTYQWAKRFVPYAEIIRSKEILFKGHMDRNMESISVPFFPEQK